MGETIVLPKSGLKLPRGERESWRTDRPILAFVAHHIHGYWRAMLGNVEYSGTTRDECIAWLDARVLELRAALLPPGAIVLRPEEAREVVAAELWDTILRPRYGEDDLWEDVPECKKDDARAHADAVPTGPGTTSIASSRS